MKNQDLMSTCKPVGVGNTGILTDYAQKSSPDTGFANHLALIVRFEVREKWVPSEKVSILRPTHLIRKCLKCSCAPPFCLISVGYYLELHIARIASYGVSHFSPK